MGIPKPPIDVKLICAITFNTSKLVFDLKERLTTLFGPIDLESEIYDFIYTEYYAAEMGTSLKKQFIAFQNLIHRETISTIKLLTNRLEEQTSESGARRLNIDPGYVSGAKLVLATTKNYVHRIYLNKGIFGDIQLKVRNKHFFTNEWTYPDYGAAHAIQFFEKVRKRYLKQLKEENEYNKL